MYSPVRDMYIHVWTVQYKMYVAVLSSTGLCVYVYIFAQYELYVHVLRSLFVLRFYGPVNPVGSCRARSIYLTTRLLDRRSPLMG